MIQSKKDWVKKLSVLKPEDAEDIKYCMQQLDFLVNNNSVNEESVASLYNVINLLTTMKERHMGYIIRWLKQGYIED